MLNIFTILTLIFVILKLTGFITWSWWLVLMPTLLGVVFYVAVLATYVHIKSRQ